MGNFNSSNKVGIVNKTKKKMFILTFSNRNMMYMFYQELRKVRADGGIGIHAPPEDEAIKIGVIHDRYGDYVIYDLFRVQRDVVLCIEDIDEDRGVNKWTETAGVELLERGRAVKLGSDMADLAQRSQEQFAKNASEVISAKVAQVDLNGAVP